MSSSSKLISIPTTLISPLNPKPHKTLPFFPNPTLTLNLTQHLNTLFLPKPTKTHLHLQPPLLAGPPSSPPEPSPEKFTVAQQALLELLMDSGVSQEVGAFVSVNSPRYVRMVVDGVEELDEIGEVWSEEEEEEEEVVGFKEKVRVWMKEKRDDGKVAVLESFVGLSLSQAMNVARNSSGETLLGLIKKVKYVKEIFFSGSNDGGLVGKNARRMMMHLSIPIDEDLQQTLSFFEKIAARRGGLDMLGFEDTTFRYLIESFPRLLSLSLEPHMTRMVEYFESIGVHRESMRTIFLLFPPVIFWNIKVIKARVHAFEEFGLEDKDVGRMLIKYPWILSTSIHENFKEVLTFFDLEKVPKENIASAVRSWPHILGCSTSTLKVMAERIKELGVADKKFGQVISRSPQLLLQKPKEFLQVVSFIEDLGLDKEAIGTILGRCPEIFAASVEKTLKRKLEFLASIGVSKVHLPRVIKKYPELLVHNIDRTLLPRVKYLMKKGLSRRDIAFMIWRFSPLLGYSIGEVLQPKLEFLVDTMDKPIAAVVDYPRYFSYSLEKKIKPRYMVLKGKNIECSLKDMLAKNDDEFACEFLSVGNILTASPPLSHQ